jgi:hypothetical protein
MTAMTDETHLPAKLDPGALVPASPAEIRTSSAWPRTGQQWFFFSKKTTCFLFHAHPTDR